MADSSNAHVSIGDSRQNILFAILIYFPAPVKNNAGLSAYDDYIYAIDAEASD